MIIAENINDAFKCLCGQILLHGKRRTVRGGDAVCIELEPLLVRIDRPDQRILLYNERKNNPFATLYETLWVLSGSRNIEHLKFFLPRAPEYSDDGETWRAGYGPRLRFYTGASEINASDGARRTVTVDQIMNVYHCLKDDPTTRRAVMTIWDPVKEGTIKETRDRPCNNWIQFMIRDNKLNCYVTVRSNDLWFGYNINTFEWTWLQETLAKALKVKLGKYYCFMSNPHIYEEYIEKVEECVENSSLEMFMILDHNSLPPLPTLPVYDELDMEFYGNTLKLIHRMIDEGVTVREGDVIQKYLALFVAWKKMDSGEFHRVYPQVMKQLPLTDMKVAAHFYFNRQLKRSKDVVVAYKEVINGQYSLDGELPQE